MKILIIRNYPTYMNIKNNTYNIQEVGLAKALIRKGNIVDIVFWTDNVDKEEEIFFDNKFKIKVYYRKGKKILKNAWYNNIDDLILKYDVIQTCEYNQIQSWFFAKKYQKKLIVYHGPYFSDFNKKYNIMCKIFDLFFLKRYIKLNTKFIVKSELAKKFLIQKGIIEKNISVCGVGIDIQTFESCEINEDNIRKKIENSSKQIQMLYIGRIETRRDPFFIIDVLREMNKYKDTMLYIIGTGEKKYTQKLKKYIIEKGMKEKIIWKDKCEQKYLSEYYNKAKVFILPTKYEIFGMVLLEAMYYGCITYTTLNGGSSTLIKQNENGIIIEDRNSEKWANTIIEMDKKSELENEIAKNAHETIKEEYLWDSIVDKFIKSYNSIHCENELKGE